MNKYLSVSFVKSEISRHYVRDKVDQLRCWYRGFVGVYFEFCLFVSVHGYFTINVYVIVRSKRSVLNVWRPNSLFFFIFLVISLVSFFFFSIVFLGTVLSFLPSLPPSRQVHLEELYFYSIDFIELPSLLVVFVTIVFLITCFFLDRLLWYVLNRRVLFPLLCVFFQIVGSFYYSLRLYVLSSISSIVLFYPLYVMSFWVPDCEKTLMSFWTLWILVLRVT